MRKRLTAPALLFFSLLFLVMLLASDTPKITQSLSAEALDSKTIRVSWSPVIGAKKYRLYKCTPSADWKMLCETDQTCYTDAEVTDGCLYEYRTECLINGSWRLYNEEGIITHTWTQDKIILRCAVSDLNEAGFTVSGYIISDVQVEAVRAAVWTLSEGQDDLEWITAERDSSCFSVRVETASHGNEKGLYIIHLVPVGADGEADRDRVCYLYAEVPEEKVSFCHPVLVSSSPESAETAVSFTSETEIQRITAEVRTGDGTLLDSETRVSEDIIRTRTDLSGLSEGCTALSVKYTAETADGQYTFETSFYPGDSGLTVTSIDVGHGDCTLLLSDGEGLLVDCGRSETIPAVITVLREKGLRKVDVLITHNHMDHIGGIIRLSAAGYVNRVYLPSPGAETYTDDRGADLVRDWLSLCGIDTEPLPAVGESLRYGDAVIRRIGAGRFFSLSEPSSCNNNSVWLKAEYAGKSVLLCGDAELGAEEYMLQSGTDLCADLLKLSHHGADSSTSEAFLLSVSPELAFCSGHETIDSSKAETLLSELGIPLYNTKTDGTTEFVINENGLFVSR